MLATKNAFLSLLLVTLALGCSSAEGEQSAEADAGSARPDAAPGNPVPEDPPDDVCMGTPCSIDDQCGCEGGDACDLDPAQFASGGTECRHATGTGMDTTSCTTSTECAIGYTCNGNPGHCRRFCDDDLDCDDTAHCLHPFQYRGSDGKLHSAPDVELCTKACKADSGSGCPPDRTCRLIRRDSEVEANFWYTDCRPGDAAAEGQGAACSGDDDCQPGYDCSKAAFTCRKICIFTQDGLPGSAQCPDGTTCRAYSPAATFGATQYGYCL